MMKHISVDTIFFKHVKFPFAAEHHLCDHVFLYCQSFFGYMTQLWREAAWDKPMFLSKVFFQNRFRIE